MSTVTEFNTTSVVSQINELIKSQLDAYAAKLSAQLKDKFDEEIEGKRKALVLEAASKIMTICQMRTIDKNSLEVRIVVNKKD